MKKKITITLQIAILTFILSCSATSKIYGDDNKTLVGQLSEENYDTLKQFLANSSTTALKDTIIIKYDYNKETCWNAFDQREDSVIKYFIAKTNERVEAAKASKINTSIFTFREPGGKINKIKKWDDKIIIDKEKILYNLLFKKPTTCGTSIIILPNRTFILLRSDAHFEALDYDKAKIEAVLIK